MKNFSARVKSPFDQKNGGKSRKLVRHVFDSPAIGSTMN